MFRIIFKICWVKIAPTKPCCCCAVAKWCPTLCNPVKVKVLVAQSCPAFGNLMDYNPPGSSVHRILQVRILEWVAISICKGSSQPRDQTRVSCLTGVFFNIWATRETMDCSIPGFSVRHSLRVCSEYVHWVGDAI